MFHPTGQFCRLCEECYAKACGQAIIKRRLIYNKKIKNKNK